MLEGLAQAVDFTNRLQDAPTCAGGLGDPGVCGSTLGDSLEQQESANDELQQESPPQKGIDRIVISKSFAVLNTKKLRGVVRGIVQSIVFRGFRKPAIMCIPVWPSRVRMTTN